MSESIKQQDKMKQAVAKAALNYIPEGCFLGVGSGSTMMHFVSYLPEIKDRIQACVPSSETIKQALLQQGLKVMELFEVPELSLYVDGADACNACRELVKGRGGALTREKILAKAANEFLCLIDETKLGQAFLEVPVPIEVIPMARSLIARTLVRLGGKPSLRQGVVTDNGNLILDVSGLPMNHPLELEKSLKQLIGVVESGIFAETRPNLVLVSDAYLQVSRME